MKKVFGLLITLAMLISTAVVPVSAEDATTLSGTGIETDPYIIATVADLKLARDLINADTAGTGAAAAYYEVTADITLPDGEMWTPIGVYSSASFKGHFDGGNHAIKNISIVLDDDSYDANYTAAPYLGFFGRVHGATISNLGIENVVITNNATWESNAVARKVSAIGGFVACANDDTTITSCYVKNATLLHASSGTSTHIGGFVGCGGGNRTPKFNNCYVYGATLAGTSSSERSTVHGFVGSISNTRMEYKNCYTANIATNPETVALTPFYAFGESWYMGIGDTTPTNQGVTNCYSEADDIPFSEEDKRSYDPTKSAGTVGMTKEALVNAMTAVGYVTNTAINNGYPCLEWELSRISLSWDGTAATAFAGGSGTAEDPYQITTAAELKLASDMTNDTTINGEWSGSFYFKLMNDIDYENNYWTPMGKSNSSGSYAFRGAFYGNGHVVRNLQIDHTEAFRYCGFFGLVAYAEISDLGIENFQLVHDNASSEKRFWNIAGFAAGIQGTTTITNCYLKDSAIKQTSQWNSCENILSGFIGTADLSNSPMEIKNCYVENVDLHSGVQIPTTAFINGAIFPAEGDEAKLKLTNCYAANVRNNNAAATFYAFGFAGGAYNAQRQFDADKIILTNCYSEATTTEGSFAATSDNNKWQLVEGTYFGTENQSEAQIASAFETLEGWQDGDNINNGLPALAWEPAPVIYPYVVNAVSVATGTVSLTVNEATPGDTLYVATYDNSGRLIGATSVTPANGSNAIVVPAAGAATVKVLIWNEMTPVIDAVVKDLY